jgi:tRNA 2-thiouridine synthesizing protein E
MDLPTNVLIVTSDRGTVQHLAGTASESIALRFARNAYEASAVVETFPPAFAVVDEDVITSGNGDLLNSISNDPRLPGLKIVLAVASGAAHSLGDGTIRRFVRLIEKPFGLREIAATIESFPVEMVLLEGFDNWDIRPTRGRPMMQVQRAGTSAGVKTADGAKLNDDGFLDTMSSWTRSSAETLAVEHEIGPLTDEHWKVIEYVQEYYRTYGKGPPVVKVHKETGLTSADICRLFPCGMVKGAYRLAGLPRPPGCG